MAKMVSERDFQIVTLDKISTIQPRPEYIFVINNIDARVAIKNSPKSKVLNIDRGNTDYVYHMLMNR